MSFLDTSTKVTKLILMWALILFVGFVLFWVGTSIYANVTENNIDDGLPDFPSIKKAQYQVTVKATGEVLFTDDYDTALGVKGEAHTLHGYWQVKDNKFRYFDHDLVLDEYYFGNIIITRRTE